MMREIGASKNWKSTARVTFQDTTINNNVFAKLLLQKTAVTFLLQYLHPLFRALYLERHFACSGERMHAAKRK